MFIPVSYTINKPLYEQVVDGIKDKIYNGELSSGDLLPSIRELAGDLKMSVITVKRAYYELEALGLITTRAGIGSFVAEISRGEIIKAKKEEITQKIKSVISSAKSFDISHYELMEIIDKTLKEEY